MSQEGSGSFLLPQGEQGGAQGARGARGAGGGAGVECGGCIEAKGEVGVKRYEDHGERLKGECKKRYRRGRITKRQKNENFFKDA